MIVKLCTECKYFRENEQFMKRKGLFITRLESTFNSVKYGMREISLEYASFARKDYNVIITCGSAARFWEPKE